MYRVRASSFAQPIRAQVGRHDGRQGQADGLGAAVHFTRDQRRAVGDLDLAGERGLRPVQQRREHLAGLIGVVVDGLLALLG